MSIPLYGALPYRDRLGNDIYPDYRNMLRMEAVLEDPNLSDTEKTAACLTLLYGTLPKDLKAAMQELLWFYYRGEEPGKPNARAQKLYDFDEDAPYILAGFLSSYGIDLSDESVHLHWWTFLSLFIALPESTQMMRIMCDRGVDTSKLKGETKRYYEERKRAVALKKGKLPTHATAEERRRAKQEKLDALYREAQRKAQGGNEHGL